MGVRGMWLEGENQLVGCFKWFYEAHWYVQCYILDRVLHSRVLEDSDGMSGYGNKKKGIILYTFYCPLQGLVYFFKGVILIVHKNTRVNRVIKKFAKNRIRSLVNEFIRCKKQSAGIPAGFLFA